MTLAVIFDSVGVGEWFILLAVVLIVVGPKRLPSTIRKFGNYYSKFRRAAESFKRQLMEMDTELNNVIKDAEREVESAVSIPEASEDYSPAEGAAAYERDFDTGDYPEGDYGGEDHYGAPDDVPDDSGSGDAGDAASVAAENTDVKDGDKTASES